MIRIAQLGTHRSRSESIGNVGQREKAEKSLHEGFATFGGLVEGWKVGEEVFKNLFLPLSPLFSFQHHIYVIIFNNKKEQDEDEANNLC